MSEDPKNPKGGSKGGGAGSSEPPGPPVDENKLIAERRAKLTEARAAGQAFPNDYRRDALAGELHAAYGDRDDAWFAANPTRVHVGGRMLFKRITAAAGFAGFFLRPRLIQLLLQNA